MPAHTFTGCVSAVVFDIEGTVAPISFVKDTLFPYALKALPAYLAANWDDAAFRDDHLAAFPEDARRSREALAAHVEDLTGRDVKVARLKNLQGALWRCGYEDGELVTPLFDDVLPRLRRWRGSAGVERMAIFSSGSVEAQKMFFAHVETPLSLRAEPETAGHGGGGGGAGEAIAPDDKQRRVAQLDLRPLFEPFWFDTVNAGNKFERSSYEKIARELGVEASRVLFLSDHIRECRAAVEAGLKSVLLVRPGNPAQELQGEDEIPVARTLDDIDIVVGKAE